MKIRKSAQISLLMNHKTMQPTIEELKKTYESMRDDQILNLLEGEGMRPEAIKILKDIIKKRWIKDNLIPQNTIIEKKESIKSEHNKSKIGLSLSLIGVFISLFFWLVWWELWKELWRNSHGSEQSKMEIYKKEPSEFVFNAARLRELSWNPDNKNKDFSKEINELRQKREDIEKKIENEGWNKEEFLKEILPLLKLTGDYINLLNRDALISLTKTTNTNTYRLLPSADLLKIEPQVIEGIGQDLVEKQKKQLEVSFQSEIDNGRISLKEIDPEKVIKLAENIYKEKLEKDEAFYNLLFN